MTSNPQGWMGHSGSAVSTVRIIIKGCSHGNSLGIFFSSFPWNISLLRWFDGVSQCQYLLSLNINHVPINNDFKKITNTAVLDRDDNLSWLRLQWYWSCYSNEITYFNYLQPYFSALGTVLPKSFKEAYSVNSHLDVRNLSERYQDIVGWSFYEHK